MIGYSLSGVIRGQSLYTLLRQLMKKPPEKVFSAMSTSTNAFSMVYALVNSDTDVIFLVETNIDYFNIVNPSPAKKNPEARVR